MCVLTIGHPKWVSVTFVVLDIMIFPFQKQFIVDTKANCLREVLPLNRAIDLRTYALPNGVGVLLRCFFPRYISGLCSQKHC